MEASINISEDCYKINLNSAVCISTPFGSKELLPKAFHAPDLHIEAVRNGDFVGSTQEGGILNFKNIFINPHGNGTHTECVGHISKEEFYIKDCLKSFHHLTQLVTINPEVIGEDRVITLKQIESIKLNGKVNCLIIRTLPNSKEDKFRDWSETNPAYIAPEAMKLITELGIEHFMVDTPSVDREHDEGKLLAHKYFWQYPEGPIRLHATISEMVYVHKDVKDGLFLVNIQILPLLMDASPSNILLYPILS
ncbi:MAG: cyclase family protein [Chitinophagales bacterium]